jgi:hypothetical protein
VPVPGVSLARVVLVPRAALLVLAGDLLDFRRGSFAFVLSCCLAAESGLLRLLLVST